MAQTPSGAMKGFTRRIGIPLDDYLRQVANGLRWCTTCKCMEPFSLFGPDLNRADGINRHCRSSRRVKIRVCTKGRPSPNKGKKFSPSPNSGRRPGFVSEKRGIPRTPEDRSKISAAVRAVALRGTSCPSYVDGKGAERRGLRLSLEYKRWRFDVCVRDEFRCQFCGDNRGGNLHAHHILPFAIFLLARFCVSNGITLCDVCHRGVHSGINN